MESVRPPLLGLPARRSSRRWRVASTWAASIAFHVAVVAVVGGWAFRSLTSAPHRSDLESAERLVSVELPSMAETSLSTEGAAEARRDPVGDPPRVSGGATTPRLDTHRDGRGGDPTVDRPAMHLAEVDERMRLSRGTQSHLDRDQVQRVRSDDARSSREDRRSTPAPMDLAFLSSGDLARLERRSPSSHDPVRGVLESRPASAAGGALGAAASEGEGAAGPVGGAREGVRASAPGEGVRDGAPGVAHRAAAAVGRSRPDVTLASVSVESSVKGRTRDDVDSDQELAAKVQALVHASTAGGVVGVSGVGGVGGGGAAGALGLAGPGSHPSRLGDGVGDWFDLSSTDPRVVAYFRRFHAKVDPLWANAFPKSAMLELRQGTVILEVTIAADGTARVAWPPARPSGIDEFDRNCADAVRRASPFDPIPKELGTTTLHIRAPFVASNPMVH